MLNWDDVKFFLAVARAGSLSAAAGRLGVDHTTVSRRITGLEQELGTTLFIKERRGYRLTDSGTTLVAHAENMETNSLSLMQSLTSETVSAAGTVRLATPEAFGSQFLSHHWRDFQEQFPDITIELIAETRPLSLTKREADLAVSVFLPEHGRLMSSKIADYTLGLYAAPEYLKQFEPINRLQDLADHNFISYVDDLMPIQQLHLLEKTFKNPNVVFRSTNVTAQTHACLDGVGLALLHCFHADRIKGLVRVLPDKVHVRRDLWLLVHKDLHGLPHIQAVMHFLKALVKRQKGLLIGKQE